MRAGRGFCCLTIVAQTATGSKMSPTATICGLQFENLVVNHLDLLLPRLGLAGQTILSAAPFALRGGDGRRGIQIDLLIQTRRAAYVVEVKRRDRIGPEIEDELAQKLAAFPRRRGVSVFTALVYEGELSSSVIRDGVFDFIVPFGEMLGLPA